MAHPNVDIVKDGFAAFERGDLETLQNRFFAPGIVWHVGGRSQLAGDYAGTEAVMQWLGRVFELSGGTFSMALHDVVGNEDHVVALMAVRASRGGKQLADQLTQVFHMRDGKATESWLTTNDPYAADEFWG